MKYQVALFDFDYTLVNSEKGILKCFRLALQEQGYPNPGDEKLRRQIGLPMEKACSIILGTDDTMVIRRFLDCYKIYADRYMTGETHFYPHTIALLQQLRQQGMRLGIISSKTRSRIEEKFTLDDIHDLIAYIVGSHDVEHHKPAPDDILKAMQHFHVAPEAVLYTGDSYVDAEAAQRAGVDFAAVTTGTTSAEQFQQYPHVAILEDIGQLASVVVR